MISFYTLSTILIIHYLFDFVFQSEWMAKNKSKELNPLMLHICVYSMGLVLMMMFNIHLFVNVPIYVLNLWFWTNLTAHFLTDFISSTISAHFFSNNKTRYGFLTVGLDQLIHYLTIFYTLLLLQNQ